MDKGSDSNEQEKAYTPLEELHLKTERLRELANIGRTFEDTKKDLTNGEKRVVINMEIHTPDEQIDSGELRLKHLNLDWMRRTGFLGNLQSVQSIHQGGYMGNVLPPGMVDQDVAIYIIDMMLERVRLEADKVKADIQSLCGEVSSGDLSVS